MPVLCVVGLLQHAQVGIDDARVCLRSAPAKLVASLVCSMPCCCKLKKRRTKVDAVRCHKWSQKQSQVAVIRQQLCCGNSTGLVLCTLWMATALLWIMC